MSKNTIILLIFDFVVTFIIIILRENKLLAWKTPREEMHFNIEISITNIPYNNQALY